MTKRGGFGAYRVSDMMYRLKRVRIYKIIFDKSLWVSEQEVEERAVILTGLALERQIFSSRVDLPLGSVRRKNPKGEKRKDNGSFLSLNKSRSAERKSAPFLTFVPRCLCSHLFIKKNTGMHHNLK